MLADMDVEALEARREAIRRLSGLDREHPRRYQLRPEKWRGSGSRLG